MQKNNRKFKDIALFEPGNQAYYLLPFRFHALNKDKEILVNEVGDYLIVPAGTAARIAEHSISYQTEKELYNDLLGGFFISETPIPLLEKVLETRYRTKKSFLEHFTALHIFVITLRCEHTCHYCQVSRVTDNKVDFDMSIEDIDAGIAIMMKSPNPHVTMEFQGGEALLAFDNIKYAVISAKVASEIANKTISFVICTNLAPLTDDILSFCKEYDILISTSLDGPDYVHNKNRHRPEKNSHQLTISGIERCRQELGDEKVSALLTTSNLSLNFPNEIVDEYVSRNFCNIFLRPISPYGFAKHNAAKNKYETDRFLEFYKAALDRILYYNHSGYFLREDYATIILKKILTPFPVGYVDLQSPAGIINSVIVFNYDGNIYASDESRMLAEMNDFTFLLGKLGATSYDDIFYGEKAMSFTDASINESLAGCSDCAFQTYCGADPVLHHATQGDMYGYRPTSVFCQRNMEIIRYLIELMEYDKTTERIFRSWITGISL